MYNSSIISCILLLALCFVEREASASRSAAFAVGWQPTLRGNAVRQTPNAPSDTIHALGEVTVTRLRRPFADLIPGQTLGGKRLAALNSHSVADAMRYFSGVQIKDYGGIGGVKTVDMRSMGTNHMGIFYDGIQLGNAQNGQIDLGRFSLDNVESIVMYNGQRSEIFQSAKDFGSAGTAYIQSRRPHFVGDKRMNVGLTMRIGSFGLANPSLIIERKLSERVSSSFSGEYTSATGRYHFRYHRLFPNGRTAWDTTAVRQNGDIEALRLEGGLYGTLPSEGYWQLKAYYYDSERGIPGAIVNNVWKNSQRQWDRSFFVQGRVRHKVSDFYSFQINAKYARDYMRYQNPDTTLMLVDNRYWQNEAYVSTANRFTLLPQLTANVSVDYQWNDLTSTVRNSGSPYRHTVLTAGALAWQWRCLKAQGSLLTTIIDDHYTPLADYQTVRHNTLSRLTPALFISLTPFGRHDITFRAFTKRVFRMPTFNDLYYTDLGTATLKPEMATQYNAGVTYHLERPASLYRTLDCSLDVYYNRVKDKIIAVPKGSGQYRWMMMNLGLVKIRGIDFTGGSTFALPCDIGLNIHATYTYQCAADYSFPNDNVPPKGSYKGQIAYVPRHSASATVQGTWHGAELNYSFIYVGERYHTSSNIQANYEPAWYTHDLALTYAFRLLGARLRLSAEVNNLLNQQYEVIQNYPMPGRHYKLIIKCDI